jgi:hypothetical protein
MELFQGQMGQIGSVSALVCAVGLALIVAVKAIEAALKSVGGTFTSAVNGMGALRVAAAARRSRRIERRAEAQARAERVKAEALVAATERCAKGLEAAHDHVRALALAKRDVFVGPKRVITTESSRLYGTLPDGTLKQITAIELIGTSVTGLQVMDLGNSELKQWRKPNEITLKS